MIAVSSDSRARVFDEQVTRTRSEPARLTARVRSVDAYRGLVMLLLFGEVLRSCAVSAASPQSVFWGTFCSQQTHAAWVGASLHDLIQPSFYFLVGIALLISVRRRTSTGQSWTTIATHTVKRCVVLVFLGMALTSAHQRHWIWIFTDTLSQIGLASPFALLIATKGKRTWWVSLSAILGTYWLVFVLYPVSYAMVAAPAGVPAEWLADHGLHGFAAHWQKNANVAAVFDHWFLNLFPRDTPYIGSDNGLTTLNFIPSICTIVLGFFAGDVIQSTATLRTRLASLSCAGLVLIVAGLSLNALGMAPMVKAIWTPSWVMFSGGCCFLLLALFYGVGEAFGNPRAFFPMEVVGTNSIVAYSLSHLFPAFMFNSIRRVVGSRPFELFGSGYDPFLYGIAVILFYWMLLFVLYRRRIFVRV